MRILFTNNTYFPDIGGVNTLLKNILEDLSNNDSIVTILTTNPHKLNDNEIINKVNIIRINSPLYIRLYGFSPEIGFYLLKHLEKDLCSDLIHIQGYHSLLSLEIALICRIKKIPFVFSPHFSPQGQNLKFGKVFFKIYKPVGGLIFKWAQRIICASQFEANTIKNEFRIKNETIEVIPHGVEKLELRTRKHNNKKVSLLFVGVLLELKGVQYLLHTVHYLKNHCKKDISLTIVGSGEYEPILKKLSYDLSIEEQVIWYSNLFGEELYTKYKEADVLLLLSRSENYGIVIAEALALGTPCIVSKTTALNEFLDESGCFGIDYPPNIEILSNLIIEICENNAQVDSVSKKIRTWKEVAKDYQEVYYEVLSKKNNCICQ